MTSAGPTHDPVIVIVEPMQAGAVAALRAAHAVLHDPALAAAPARLAAALAGARALILRDSLPVDAALLAQAPRLAVIGRLGAGLGGIDLGACRARGKTLGIVGFGDIGRRVAKLARAFGMAIVAHDPVLPEGHAGWSETPTERLELAALLARADAVTLHVPPVPATRGLIAAPQLALMKPGAVLVNTAGGGVVEEAALAAALRGGQLAGAALDVFGEEPLPPGSPLAGCPNLILSPHVAGMTLESDARVSTLIAERVLVALAMG